MTNKTNKSICSPKTITALWSAEECYSFLNIGRSSWYAGVSEGRFPKPIYLGPRMSRWKKSDLEKLILGDL